jgi:CheY-like chemotaxis protein/signal transduction histidine kinase
MSAVLGRIAFFVSELKRRRVLRIAVAYAVLSLVVVSAAALVSLALPLPSGVLPLVIFFLVLGFPIAMVLGWAFDIEPTGIVRTEPIARPQPVVLPEPAPELAEASISREQLETGSPNDIQLGPSPELKVADPVVPRTAPQLMVTASEPTRERIERASLAQVRDQLRTPASAIVSYSRMLLADLTGPGREALRGDVEKIRAAGELFLARVQDLLDPDHIAAREQSEDRVLVLGRLRHELRTPLNAVIGYSELIMESLVENGGDQSIAEDIRQILAAAREALTAAEGLVDSAEMGQTRGVGLTRATALAQEVLSKIQPLWADSSGVPLREGTVLVIDDAEANRELLVHQLARQGYTVTKAASGKAAFEILEAQLVDIILLDILMPGMDGIDVLRRLKADPALREIPVIVISALDELDSVIRCIQMGAEDFVTKPFDPVLLGARIGTILEVRCLRERERAYADALNRQQEWSDRLLRRAFPSVLAERLKAGDTGIVESTADGTVLVAGVQGPAELTRFGPCAQVETVGALFARFDTILDQMGLELVKTTGHGYTVVAGLLSQKDNHERVIADLALALHEETRRFSEETQQQYRLRIGIHVGAVAAGIIASRHLAFDLWGDAVETAQQLQITAAPGTIQVSQSLYARLRESYSMLSRGIVEVRGKGEMQTYNLQGRLEPTGTTRAITA